VFTKGVALYLIELPFGKDLKSATEKAGTTWSCAPYISFKCPCGSGKKYKKCCGKA
jgi:hypothetical protein